MENTKVYIEGKDEKEDEDSGKLPPLSKGDDLDCLEILHQQHFTQPPSRYSEATLVKAMEEYGIGRPSTYATIVSTIQARGYVGKEKKMLYLHIKQVLFRHSTCP